MTDSPSPARPWSAVGAGAAVVAACAVCCAGPLLGLLGGLGVLSAVGALWIPALAALAVAAVLGVLWVLRRRRAATCKSEAGVVDLGMPTPTPPQDGPEPLRR